MTRPEFFVEEHQILSALFDEGLETLHLRKPHTEPVFSERLLSLIDKKDRKKIVVHDHFYLKNEYDLKGIHVNSRTAELPQNYRGHISCTCSNEEELKSCSSFCDYMFLSPIFETNGEAGFSPSFTKTRLKKMASDRLITRKVMALGGVNLEHLPMLRDLGFGGVVIFGDIWNRFDIHTHADFKEVINHFRKLRKAAE